jgi:hypothetical protein
MSDPTKIETASVVAFLVALALFIVAASFAIQNAFDWEKDAHAHKVEAVKHGGAEWRTDAEGNVTFHWKDCNPNPVKP